jgi:hypothetical protein
VFEGNTDKTYNHPSCSEKGYPGMSKIVVKSCKECGGEDEEDTLDIAVCACDANHTGASCETNLNLEADDFCSESNALRLKLRSERKKFQDGDDDDHKNTLDNKRVAFNNKMAERCECSSLVDDSLDFKKCVSDSSPTVPGVLTIQDLMI